MRAWPVIPRSPHVAARCGPAVARSPPPVTPPPTAPPWPTTSWPSSTRLGLGPGAVVTSYVAVPGEPPTAALNAALAAHGIRVLVPITLADLDLDWPDAFDATDAASAALGPDGVALADLVLAPGLAVDRTGHPDGPGRRLLRPGPAAPPARARPWWSCCTPASCSTRTSRALPRQAHDQPVDAVVTADGVTDLGLSPWSRRPPAAG